MSIISLNLSFVLLQNTPTQTQTHSYTPTLTLYSLTNPHTSPAPSLHNTHTHTPTQSHTLKHLHLPLHTRLHDAFSLSHTHPRRAGWAKKSLELNNQIIQLERSGEQHRAFDINEFHGNAKAVATELLKGSLVLAEKSLKKLLGER